MVNRIVTGAHYGLRDWLAQRITGAVMAIYALILLFVFFFNVPINYGAWRAVFEQSWMRVATLLFAASLGWHAWVGMRDVLMDYVKPAGLRLFLEILVVLVLGGYVAWAIQILWR